MSIQRTGLGTTGLGAVGGPRGVAAGSLRIIVEFFTQYDPKAVKQIEADLAQLTKAEKANDLLSLRNATSVEKAKSKVLEAEVLARAKFTNRTAKTLFKQSEDLRATGRAVDKREASKLLTAAIARQGLSRAEEKIIRQMVSARTRLVTLEARQNSLAASRLGIEEQQVALQSQQSRFQALKGGVLPRLGGLAVGAVGGVLGGALIGGGFALMDAALEKVGDALKDILDPARHAREALKEVGAAINAIKDAGTNLSDEQAARRYLTDLGISADTATVAALAQAAAQERIRASIDAYIQTQTAKSHGDATEKENIKLITDALIGEAKRRGDLKQILMTSGRAMGAVTDSAYYEAEAMKVLAKFHDAAGIAAARQAAEEKNLARSIAATASLAKFAEQNVVNLIEARGKTLTAPIDRQISGLKSGGGGGGPSAREKGIQSQIERLRNATSAASAQRERVNLAEEKALILLRIRFRMLGLNIDLEKFESKFLLEAIEAKSKAIEKQARAQSRLERSLDLQFKKSQELRRDESESISEFLERRAQHNRDLLNQQRDLERELAQESLDELKEKTEQEVALTDVSEKQKTLLQQQATDARIAQLEKQLANVKRVDSASTSSRLTSLERQKTAQEQAVANAIKYSNAAANAEIREAARAAKTIEQISALAGPKSGLVMAKAFLENLIKSGILTGRQTDAVREVVSDINFTLHSLSDKLHAIVDRPGARRPPGFRFQHGGFIPLNGGSTPFGQNARFGEAGTEAGMMVFPNSISRMLLKNKDQQGMFGDVIIQKSDDPYRDRYNLKRAMTEVLEDSLR